MDIAEWQRRVALDFAQAFPLETTADDMHLAQVAEEERIAADLAEDANKAARRNAVSDRAALEIEHLDAMRKAGL